jgi:hypothetical protein
LLAVATVIEGVNKFGVRHVKLIKQVPDPQFIHTFIDRPYGKDPESAGIINTDVVLGPSPAGITARVA